MVKKFPAWVWLIACLLLLVSTLPYIYGQLQKPEGATYFGVHTNFDDHAVYAAWLKQAQEGRFLFENRFATEDHPRLTIHLYFYAIGTLSKATGIPIAMHIGRLLFSLLFVFSLFRLIQKITAVESEQKWALVGALFFGGLGWIAWTEFGQTAPIDVWQPEAFVFPSVMTNGLFAASFFFIVFVCNAILECRDDWKSVIPGALGLIILTNIHTYDTLLIALVSVPFLFAMILTKQFSKIWLFRASIIAAGALPSLFWFLHVRSSDPVFAMRAATVTNSPPISQIWSAIGLLFVVAMVGFLLKKEKSIALTFISVWAVVAPWIVYYPGLFQRKLSMAMGLPIGLLAGLAFAVLLMRLESRVIRVACSVLIIVIFSMTSVRWVVREVKMADSNLSNTAVNSIYADSDVTKIIDYLAKHKTDSDVLIAMPGIPIQKGESQFILGVPDLNPVMTGWAGIKTYVGHWSETPDYNQKRVEVKFALYQPNSTKQMASELFSKSNATYVIIPSTTNRETLMTRGPEILWQGAIPVVVTAEWTLYKKP